MASSPLFSRLAKPLLPTRLSRDSRDTFFLLIVLAWTLAAHIPHLPMWTTAFALFALGWRAWLARFDMALPGKSLLILALILSVALTYTSHQTLIGQEAGITLIVALTALKTLELRARRDAFVIFFLGFFLILTHFIYSQSLLTTLAMLASIWGLLTALVLAHMPQGRPSLRLAAGMSAKTAAIGLPIMILLFMLFPRLPPLWGRPEDIPGQMGLSGHLKLGAISQLAQDDSVAMRIRFLAGPLPSPRSLYFRGPILSAYDGTEWRTTTIEETPKLTALDKDIQVSGSAIHYEVTIEPTQLHHLALLEATLAKPKIIPIPAQPLYNQGLTWQTAQPLTERIRLTAQAWTQFTYGPPTYTHELAPYLALPPYHHPRTQAWVKQHFPALAPSHPTQIVQTLLTYIHQQGYTYSLSPGLYGQNGQDTIDEFWLDRKIGFCEHYAASFVIVLRLLGIPARIVTGFQGGEFNSIGGYLVVRNRDAHAWVEYWQPEQGWTRVDPTSAVAPERIEQGRSLQAPTGLLQDAFERVHPSWGRHLRVWWDTVNNHWNQWILNYSQSTQFNLLKQLGMSTPDWTDLIYILLGLLSGSSLIAATFWLWKTQYQPDRWLRTYHQLIKLINQTGLAVPLHCPPLTLARYLQNHTDPTSTVLIHKLHNWDALRYGQQLATSATKQPTRNQARQLLQAGKSLLRSASFKLFAAQNPYRNPECIPTDNHCHQSGYP